mmetsp:Transcript_13151/g.30733  ORF Transcript_13151/g.30733 Transcript_13151/m.30733 type:complete len:365 (-) Transcript_13151:75-1169(-)
MAMKIFVGSLPATINEQTLLDTFKVYGSVTSSVVNIQKRFALITYSAYEEAETAINAMNGFEWEGAVLTVKFADNQQAAGGGALHPGAWSSSPQVVPPPAGGAVVAPPSVPPGASDRLYIKGLPAGMNDHDVRQVFGAYATVLDTKVLVPNGEHSDGTGQTVVIIKVSSAAEAASLVANLNGKVPDVLESARALEVSYAGAAKGQGGAMVTPPGAAGARYSPYGKGGGPPGPLQFANPPPPPHMGGAPVPPPAAAPGRANVAWPDDPLIPGVPEQLASLSPKSKLYIKGLPMHADDIYLYKVFSPFGRVLSVKALPNAAGGYCIGFVNYASDDEASVAIEGLKDQVLLDGSTLQIAIKTSKGSS